MAGSGGSLYLRRDCRDSAWYIAATPLSRNLWFDMMLTANWKAGTTRSGIALVAGELVTTWPALAKRLAWTERGCRKEPTVGDVRWAMKFLKEYGEVRWTGLKSYGTYPSGRSAIPATDRATDPRQWVGLRVTLLRWAFYTSSTERGGDEATDLAQEGSVVGATDTLKKISMKKEEQKADPTPFSRPGRKRGWQPRDYPELHIADGQPPPTRSPR